MATPRRILQLRKIVKAAERDVRRGMLRAFSAVEGKTSKAEVAKALLKGDIDGAIEAVPWQEYGEPIVKQQGIRRLVDVYEQVGMKAIAAIPGGEGLFSIVDPRPAQFIAEYGADKVVQINDSIKAGLRESLDTMLQSGLSAQDTADLIRPQIGLFDRWANAAARYAAQEATDPADAARYANQLRQARALMIARTEAQFAAIQGQNDSWGIAAEKELFDPDTAKLRWHMVEDEHVDSDPCIDLDGTSIDYSDVWPEGEPPVHPNCVLGDTEVVSCGDIIATTERRYDGEIVIIETRDKSRLACTPNHPILTPKGWVAAGLLNVGSDIISCRLSEGVLIGNRDGEHGPARIEDVSHAFNLRAGVFSKPVPVSAEDFHGDGEGSNVAVVRTNRLFRNQIRNTASAEHFNQLRFVARTALSFGLNGFRLLQLLTHWARLSANRVVCGLRDRLAVLGGHRAIAVLHGRAQGEWGTSGFAQDSTYYKATNSKLLTDRIFRRSALEHRDDQRTVNFNPSIHARAMRAIVARDSPADKGVVQFVVGNSVLPENLRDRLPGDVVVDSIVKIDRERFVGNVFNLQSTHGAYIANGVVTHNCTCWIDLEL